jgi:D-alanyl-D-alanine carboxypeptidase
LLRWRRTWHRRRLLPARAWLLYDYGSAQVLAASHEHDRVEPASLTKLMTGRI